MKDLILVRGVSGAGKTTLAELIADHVFSADDYFYDLEGNYDFDPSRLRDAHMYCEERTECEMERGTTPIAVANTFTRKWEMDAYFKLAERYGYRVSTVIVENRHGGKSVHGVPDTTIDKMKTRFEVEL